MKILIIRFSSLGDLIKTTALIERICHEADNFEIHFVTKIDFASLFTEDSRLSRLLILDKKAKKATRMKNWIRANTNDLIEQIKDTQYDLVIDAHNTIRSRYYCWKLRSCYKKLIRFKKSRLRKLLLFLFRIPAPAYFLDKRLFGLLDPLFGTSQKTYLPKLVIADDKIRDDLEKKHRPNWNSTIAIIPGAAWKNKELKHDFWKNFIQSIPDSYQIALIGGEDKREKFDIKNSRVTNYMGKLDLTQSIVFASTCFKAIGVDTGVSHAVEALGEDVALILGPTGLETGAYPSRPNSQIFERELFCRPCSKNGSSPCIWGLGQLKCLQFQPSTVAKQFLEDD